ncbi:hypothetical protein EVAR_94436_1 [Eumeta japonica]|uniref:Uncharacterized protein n=1 Tax=Eumeta variegata TaxID=151549 RepID=A0A4C1TQ70_EUMVA|nr:hypothetical protein EVAR_94436_1 [Eumeta japonica]
MGLLCWRKAVVVLPAADQTSRQRSRATVVTYCDFVMFISVSSTCAVCDYKARSSFCGSTPRSGTDPTLNSSTGPNADICPPVGIVSWNGDTRARRAAPRPVPCITVRPHRRIIIVVPTSLAHLAFYAVAAALDVYSFCSDTRYVHPSAVRSFVRRRRYGTRRTNSSRLCRRIGPALGV